MQAERKENNRPLKGNSKIKYESKPLLLLALGAVPAKSLNTAILSLLEDTVFLQGDIISVANSQAMRFVRKITALSLWYGCLCSAFATHWSCVQNVCCHRELRRELWDADSSSYVHQDFVSPQPEGDFSNAKFRNYHQSSTCLQHFLVSRLLFFTNFIVCCNTAWPK